MRTLNVDPFAFAGVFRLETDGDYRFFARREHPLPASSVRSIRQRSDAVRKSGFLVPHNLWKTLWKPHGPAPVNRADPTASYCLHFMTAA
jgi:hypothetical protein